MSDTESQPVDISDLRRRLGSPGKPISQGDLAQRLGGISQSTVSRMEADPALQSGAVLKLLQILERAAPLQPMDGAA